MRAFERVLDERLRALCVCDASVELRDLAFGDVTQGSPAPAQSRDQTTDLREGEPGVLAEANEGDAFSARCRVEPPSAGTPGG
jgi:hypothetical protein